jgi:PAS domain S-box-containing protein
MRQALPFQLNEAILRHSLEVLPGALLIFDPQLRIHYANQAALTLAGKPLEAILGRPSQEVYPAEFCQRYLASLEQAQQTNQAQQLEYEWVVNQQPQHFRIQFTPQQDEAGALAYIIGTFINTTPEKQTLQTLDQLQTTFYLLFDHNPLPMWVFDTQSLVFLEVNQAAIQKYGYSRDEFLGMTIYDIRPPEDHTKLTQTLQQHAMDTLYQSQDWRHLTKDQQVLEVNVYSYRLQFMGRLATLVVADDVTEKNRILQALRESETKWHTIFHEAADVMLVVHPTDEHIMEANIAAQRWLGYPPDELKGQPFSLLQASNSSPNLLDDETLFTRPFRTRQGQIIEMDMTIFMIPWGSEVAVVVSLRDATSRLKSLETQRAAQRLAFELNKKQEVNMLRDRFFGMLAHDIRNPLASITLSVGMLLDYWEKMDSHTREKRLISIADLLTRINELLDDTLAVSQLDQYHLLFQPDDNDMVAFCQKIYMEFWEKNKATHHFRFSTSAPSIQHQFDTKLLRRVIENLLSNAFKYSPQGGEIRFEVLAQPDCLEIHISDQGIGIASEDQVKLFDPFYRAGNVQSIKGTGLGLSIVKQIVELHGGQIRVTSELNQGSQFTLCLPWSPDGLSADARPASH